MTNYYEIIAAFLVALLLTVFFSTVLKSRGPWGALWLVFIVIFLATWAGHLWINPAGPTVLGVSVVPIFVIGFIVAFILASVSVPTTKVKAKHVEDVTTVAENTEAAVTLGIFFWVLLIILLAVIATGYYRMPVNSEQLVN
jgi:amino acid transporter